MARGFPLDDPAADDVYERGHWLDLAVAAEFAGLDW